MSGAEFKREQPSTPYIQTPPATEGQPSKTGQSESKDLSEIAQKNISSDVQVPDSPNLTERRVSKQESDAPLPPEEMTEDRAYYIGQNINQLAQEILGSTPDRLNEMVPEQAQREIRRLAESEGGTAALMKFLETVHEEEGEDAGYIALAYIKTLATDPSIDEQAQHRLRNTIKVAYELILDLWEFLNGNLYPEGYDRQKHMTTRESIKALTPHKGRVIADWIDSLAEKDPELLGAAMAVLNIYAANRRLPWQKKAVRAAYKEIAERNQVRMAAKGESRAERTVHRTPMDVIVNALSLINKAIEGAPPQSPFRDSLLEIKKILKAVLITRQVDLENTTNLLQQLVRETSELGLENLSKSISVLVSQLPTTREQLTPAQMHDSIYARVIDSAIIGRLIKDPPKKVKDSLHAGGEYMAWWLRRCVNKTTANRGKMSEAFGFLVADRVQNFFNNIDPRFWSPNIPGMKAFLEASGERKFKALCDLLKQEPQGGVECVMLSSLLIKISWMCQEVRTAALNPTARAQLTGEEAEAEEWKLAAPWMKKATETYQDRIIPQTSRTDFISDMNQDGKQVTVKKQDQKKKLGTEAGITLPYQPAAIYGDEGAMPTERPVARNLLKIDEVSRPISEALMQGHAWAAGPSGSMNIALHFLRKCLPQVNKNRKGQDPIQPKDFLLGIMMFLTYDGGHSLNEALFAANLLNNKLRLGLTMKETENPNEFVADLGSFIGMYGEDEDTHQKLVEAFEGSIEDVVQYFDQHSHYREQQP